MNKATILIIEDDEDILMILKDQLELDGFSVHGVMTAEEGIKAVEEKRPDLVILDLNLPDIDGFKVCKQLRRNSDVPIIILTARDAISDKLRGFESEQMIMWLNLLNIWNFALGSRPVCGVAKNCLHLKKCLILVY